MESRRYLYFVRIPWLALCALLVLAGLFAKRGYLDWAQMSRRNVELEKSTTDLRAERDRLDRRVEALRTDRREQERVVRATLGYARPDEIVVELPQPFSEESNGPDL